MPQPIFAGGACAATLGYVGQSSGYHLAAADFFGRVGETPLGHERPESRDTTRSLEAVVKSLAEAEPARLSS